MFYNRGISPENIFHFLNTTSQDVINPASIKNMREGAKMLLSHIAQKHKIFIQVDSDCDGYTSAALLINYIYALFPTYVLSDNIYYRHHEGKQHGLIVDTIPEDVQLIIAPDSSTNDIEEHKELSEKGIDILVIDHHEADEVSNFACIINNQTCDYPNKTLSGVGMVYKFISYIDSLIGKEESTKFLDLVMLGLIGDMMNITPYETQYFIQQGLTHIRNPFIKEVVSKQQFSINKHGGLDPFSISFYVVPLINAITRTGTEEEKYLLFESMLDYKGYETIPSTKRGEKGKTEYRATQACRVCGNVRNRQATLRDASLEQIEDLIEEKNLNQHKILLIQLEESVDKNLTGLIANQLMSKYQKPVLLLNKTYSEEGEINWEGSGRNYTNSQLDNFRAFLLDTNLVMYAEGHPSAFGCGIEDSKINEFIKYCDETLKDYDFSPCYKVDLLYKGSDVEPMDIKTIAELKSIWGQGLSEPLVGIEHLTLKKTDIVYFTSGKSPTLRINLPNGLSLIKFNFTSEEFNELYPEEGCVILDIVGKCDLNTWNDIDSPQIKIEELCIVNKQKYYF